MSSTGTMSDEAFSERVKKTFGNLFANITPEPTPSSLSNPNPLWSLAGGEVKKREWRREQDTTDRENTPCASSFHDFVSCARNNSSKNLKSYKKEFDDDGMEGINHGKIEDQDEDDEGVQKCGLDDWDLKGSIGLDPTLDYEEEEDTYDKVALGRENAGERLYMKDISGSSNSNYSSKNDLLCGIGGRRRDPRANWSAAMMRLKEDDTETGMATEVHKYYHCKVPCASSGQAPVSSVEKVVPILKKRKNEPNSNPPKRVRFDLGCLGDGSAGEVRVNLGDEKTSEVTTQGNVSNNSNLEEKVRRVPDYVSDPSKYTRYCLDSIDAMTDESNSGACVDLLHMTKKSDNTEFQSEQSDAASAPTSASDLPQSITFIPKKKSDPAKADGVHDELTDVRESEMKHFSIESTVVSGFAAEEVLETEVGDMEVDDPDRVTSFRKQERRYRSKSEADEPE